MIQFLACGSKWFGSHEKLGDIVSFSFLFCNAIAYKCQREVVTICKKEENTGGRSYWFN